MVRLVDLEGAVFAERGGKLIGRSTDRQGHDVTERAGKRHRFQRCRSDRATIVLDDHEGPRHVSLVI